METPAVVNGMLLDPEVRSNLYRFLAAAYLRPLGEEAVRYLTSKGVIQELRSVFGERVMPALRSLRDDAATDADDRLAQDFMDLFEVPGGRYVTPFEDVYRGATADRTLGPLLGERAVAARRLYREAGAEVDADCKQLPTHIGVELAFMGFLCAQEARTRSGGAVTSAAAGAASGSPEHFRAIQSRFLGEHLNGWFADLSRAIQAQAGTGIYRGLAQLTEVFLAHETASLLPRRAEARAIAC